MAVKLNTIRIIAVSLFMFISACTANLGVDDLFSETLNSTEERGNGDFATKQRSRHLLESNEKNTFDGVTHQGTGSFISSRAPAIEEGKTRAGETGYTLNLVNAPITAAAKSVLSDILEVPYIIDSRVTGNITLQTTTPISRDAIVDIFETTLSLNGAGIIRRGGKYQVVPLADAIESSPQVSIPSLARRGPGIQVHVIELRHIAAEEMKTILEPISRRGSILRADPERNLLVLAGTRSDLTAMRDSISVFDVDWMRGMSVALHPLKTARPAEITGELNTIFKTDGGPGRKIIRFVANERLNSVLVITARPTYLKRAAIWIDKLDQIAGNNQDQLFVYEIQNRSVQELAEVLQSVLAGNTTEAVSSAVAPDVTPVLVTSQADTSSNQQAENRSDGFAPAKVDGVSIVADEDNNALLISTTPRKYKRIERILRQLDILPTQVMLEAIIAEVTLNDQLEFGIRWALESGNFSLSLSDLATGFVGAQFPGFNFGFATSDVQVTLNALSSITDVNVISSPTLMALNNQKAVLQVGDQVPIVTQQTSGTVAANAPVINSVELRDTGIILTVTPRVNSSGRVMLDIEQEVSDVVNTTTSGIDSPTIRQRRIATRVVVNDGESLALGGLIQERNELSRGQVPVLGDIPIFGNLFKDKTDTINKTELIVFIRPRVIRNIREARDVTSEFREKLTFESAISSRRGGANRLEQDLKRLSN